jgi:hypothetical protein
MRRRMSLYPAPTTGLRPVDEPTGFAQDRSEGVGPQRSISALRCEVGMGNAVVPAKRVFVEEDPDVSHAER